ncbi:thioredoxin family protein [Stenotrophomonas sp.]|uniref:thioredoxin family protein n=1 Tax=Stenotrophomonas sp. TaxID=69392 RepID=UPI002898DB7D|nr:thioredoxin family protein [Stenotrophomonas sp.]
MLTLHAATPDQYNAALREHPRLLVDFHKDDCPGCRMLDMSLASLADSPRAAGVVLLKVKLETIGEVFFRSLGLRQTPTLLLVHDGQEVARLAGYQSPGKIGEALASVLPG